VGAAVLAVALSAVVASQQVGDWDGMTAAQRAEIDPTASSLIGVLFTTVILGSLAVRTITSEYSTGMIRLTFSAMPHRRRVVLAKAVMVAGLALGSALVANLVAFVVGQGILSSVDASTTLGAPGVTRSIVFGALAVTAATILGVGLGAIMRRTAAATTTLAMAIIGTQMFAGVLPEGARRLLPGVVLQATVTGDPSEDLLAPMPALLILGGYAAVALVVAAVFVSRRDV
jgi:ABC-2 type transport system permease protein